MENCGREGLHRGSVHCHCHDADDSGDDKDDDGGVGGDEGDDGDDGDYLSPGRWRGSCPTVPRRKRSST